MESLFLPCSWAAAGIAASTFFSGASPGGPFKPFFGLSGALRPDRVSPPLFLACALSIRIQSPPSLHNPSCTGENCSTPSPLHGRIGHASPDCDEYIEVFPRTELHCEH